MVRRLLQPGHNHIKKSLINNQSDTTISDVLVGMSLLFNKQPGCMESHLQRQYQNTLLSKRQSVTQTSVNEASNQDQQELISFKQAFTHLMNQAATLEANTQSDTILTLKENIDKLYEQCAGLAGDPSRYRKALEKMMHVVMQSIRHGAGNDPVAHEELSQEAAARAQHYALLRFPLVSHMLRTDSPIQPEELAAVLLGETGEVVVAITGLLDTPHISDLYHRARQLMSGRLEENIPGAPFARQNLELIQQATQGTACTEKSGTTNHTK